MVHLELQNLGKRFNRHWIFRRLHYTFKTGNAYAITGANGSGKSTLLQVLSGATTLSEGNVLLKINEGRHDINNGNVSSADNSSSSIISPENHHRYLTLAAPYLEVIEEMTLTEFLTFHFQFKTPLPGYAIPTIIEWIQLSAAAHRQIRHYSSGMKQRVKLAQAIFSNVPIVLLDEPLTNLDAKGAELYYQLIDRFCRDRLLIICSNNESEIHFCKERLEVEKYR